MHETSVMIQGRFTERHRFGAKRSPLRVSRLFISAWLILVVPDLAIAQPTNQFKTADTSSPRDTGRPPRHIPTAETRQGEPEMMWLGHNSLIQPRSARFLVEHLDTQY